MYELVASPAYRVGSPVIVTQHGHPVAARVYSLITVPAGSLYFVRADYGTPFVAEERMLTPRAVVGDGMVDHRPVNRRAQYDGFVYVQIAYETYSWTEERYVEGVHTAKRHGGDMGYRGTGQRCRRTRYARPDRHAEKLASDRHLDAMEARYQ